MLSDKQRVAAASAMMGAFIILMLLKKRQGEVNKVPKCIIDRRHSIRNSYIIQMIHESDVGCVAMTRMKRNIFFGLCDIMKSKKLMWNTLYVTVEEQMAMFLHVIAHSIRNRVIARNFIRSTETVSRHFQNTLYAIGELRSDYIKQPSTITHRLISSNSRFTPFFDNCIGALDGTHIHASVRGNNGAFFGRKGYPTQNVLAVADFDLRFTYVLAGWEGSAHDSLILRNALERDDGLSVPEGKYYLVDAGYSTRPGFISPFRGVRYHLKEFSDRPPTTNKELFNHRHSSLRTSIERAFGALKNRFKILICRPYFNYSTQVDVVLACCILHNYILEGGLDSFVPTIEECQTTNHGIPTTSDLRDETREWVSLRDHIMNQMWERDGY